MLSVIDHQLRHTAVDADILAGDESCFLRAQEQHHLGDVFRLPDTSHRLLDGVSPCNIGAGCVNPAG